MAVILTNNQLFYIIFILRLLNRAFKVNELNIFVLCIFCTRMKNSFLLYISNIIFIVIYIIFADATVQPISCAEIACMKAPRAEVKC